MDVFVLALRNLLFWLFCVLLHHALLLTSSPSPVIIRNGHYVGGWRRARAKEQEYGGLEEEDPISRATKRKPKVVSSDSEEDFEEKSTKAARTANRPNATAETPAWMPTKKKASGPDYSAVPSPESWRDRG